MKTNKKSLILGASVLALGLGVVANTNQAHAANQGNSLYVANVDLTFPGMAGQIHVVNTSNSNFLNQMNLAVQTTKLDIEIAGDVYCEKDDNIVFDIANAHFGPLQMNGQLINDAASLYKTSIDVGTHVWAEFNLSKDKYISESAGQNTTFSVPLNAIKNGHPAVRVDGLAELEKARQAFNGTDLEFYQQDHDILIKRAISLAGWCKSGGGMAGFETQEFNIQIKYEGDPNLTDEDGPILNAQLGGNVPNQIQQNEDLVPFKLNNVQFNVNTPHYTGKCLPEKNPKIRMHFTVAGGKQGQIDLRVKAVGGFAAAGDKYFETQGIVKDPKNGGGMLEFNFPLIEKLSEAKYVWMAKADGKTHNHGMQIEARYKNFDGSNEWSNWQEFDGETITHRCIPQIKGGLIGNGGIQGYDNGNSDPVFNGTIKATPLAPKIDGVRAPLTMPTPTPKPMGKAMPAPAPTPKPMTLRAPAPTPTPKPLTIKPIEPEPVNELQLKTR